MATEIIRLAIKAYDATNNLFENVFHYRTLGGQSADVNDMEPLVADLVAELDNLWPTTVSSKSYEVHKLDANGKWQPFTKGAYVQAGQAAGDVLPYQVAAVALGYTAIAKTIGKKFIGPLTEGVQAGGVLTEAAQTILEGFCTLWTSTWGGAIASYEPGVWSKTRGFVAIVDGVCNTILGTQRRRKPGVGA